MRSRFAPLVLLLAGCTEPYAPIEPTRSGGTITIELPERPWGASCEFSDVPTKTTGPWNEFGQVDFGQGLVVTRSGSGTADVQLGKDRRPNVSAIGTERDGWRLDLKIRWRLPMQNVTSFRPDEDGTATLDLSPIEAGSRLEIAGASRGLGAIVEGTKIRISGASRDPSWLAIRSLPTGYLMLVRNSTSESAWETLNVSRSELRRGVGLWNPEFTPPLSSYRIESPGFRIEGRKNAIEHNGVTKSLVEPTLIPTHDPLPIGPFYVIWTRSDQKGKRITEWLVVNGTE